MPTGYTADVAKGITFKQFVMNCARGFGACVTLRDEPGGGEIIPERFEPSSYYAERRTEAEARIEKLTAMSEQEAIIAMLDDYESREVARLRYLRERIALKEKYDSMLRHVEAWNVPSELNALRDFMEDQLIKSIEFDCSGDYYSTQTPKETPSEWRTRQLEDAQRDADYFLREHLAEVGRVAERNRWLKLLRDSLQD